MFADYQWQVNSAEYCATFNETCEQLYANITDIVAVSVNYNANWFSVDGQEFLRHLRSIVQKDIYWHAQGQPYDQYDSASLAFDNMPLMMMLMVRIIQREISGEYVCM
jgi:hypothetical protein